MGGRHESHGSHSRRPRHDSHGAPRRNTARRKLAIKRGTCSYASCSHTVEIVPESCTQLSMIPEAADNTCMRLLDVTVQVGKAYSGEREMVRRKCCRALRLRQRLWRMHGNATDRIRMLHLAIYPMLGLCAGSRDWNRRQSRRSPRSGPSRRILYRPPPQAISRLVRERQA